MITIRRFETRQVTRGLRRVARGVPRWTAQELNRQRGQSRTLLTRRIAKGAGISPQKRVRRRIRFPRGSAARPNRLRAEGLALTSIYPTRYFRALPPPGGELRDVELPDSVGRVPVGGRFEATMGTGRSDTWRKLEPRVWAQARRGQYWRGRLPIAPAQYVDLSDLTDRSLRAVLRELGQDWPRRMNARLVRELRRTFR